MLDALRTLSQSKRTLVTLISALLEVAILFGLWLPAASEGEAGEPVRQLAELLAAIVAGACGLLVSSLTATDVGKALSLAPGVGHRDEGNAVATLIEEPANRGFALVDAMLGLAGIALLALAGALVVWR